VLVHLDTKIKVIVNFYLNYFHFIVTLKSAFADKGQIYHKSNQQGCASVLSFRKRLMKCVKAGGGYFEQ